MAILRIAHGCAPSSHIQTQCRIVRSPKFPGGVRFSIFKNLSRIHAQFVESKVRNVQLGLSDGAPEGNDEAWCGLCGDRGGWLTCGRCMGEGGFPTRPGLAGVKGKVGWARCKTCFGQSVVPCLFCGISEVSEWKFWLEYSRRHPHQSHKPTTTP